MATKKTAAKKKAAPKKTAAKKKNAATADVEVAPAYTAWVPADMPIGGKSNSTEMLNDHPTEHNHAASAVSDIVDRFADLRLYVPGVNSCGVAGDLQVDGQVSTASRFVGQPHGNYTTPPYSFVGREDTGVFAGVDFVGFTNDGNYKLLCYNDRTLVTNHLQVEGQTQAQNGTKGAPAYSFTHDPDTGIYTGMYGGTGGIEIVGDGQRLMQLGLTAPTRGAWMPTISTRTVGTPANVWIHTDAAQEGALFRSTASRAFMQEVEAVNLDATNSVYDLAPIWYRSTCDGDNIKHSHYGLAAEDCAAVDPRLAIMATDEDGVETADNVNTNAVIALLVSAVQEQRQQISDLTARVEALETAG